MYATILSLGTAVPKAVLTPECYSAFTARLLNFSEGERARLERIVLASRIDARHSVVTDFMEDKEQMFFEQDPEAPFPKTSKRNDLYKKYAPELAAKACEDALRDWGRDHREITHVISVSCTGLIAPGIEFLLVARLGLSPTVERLGINFMGCFGAFKGLAIAKALALENPRHRVLLVCVELCSLHFQGDMNVDTLIANALFADGAAAAVIGACPREGERALFEMRSQASAALEKTEKLMSWEMGDHGCRMRLSAAVPMELRKEIRPFAERLLGNVPFDACDWAIHPGGKAILEAIAEACGLRPCQTAASWTVLRQYGNMSSPTFLFVLRQIAIERCAKSWVAGFGFGPGLSIEGTLLHYVAG